MDPLQGLPEPTDNKIKLLKTLISLNTAISARINLHSILQAVSFAAKQMVEAEGASILLLDPEHRELVFEVSEGGKGHQLTEIRIPMEKGIAGWVIEQGQSQTINSPYEDPRFFSGLDKESSFTTRNLICVPLRLKHLEATDEHQTIGVLEVVNKRDARPFTPEDQEMVELVASQAATAIENAKMMQSLRLNLQQLQSSQAGLIHSERLAFLGQLSAGIVHDLKNPLTVLIGFTQLSLAALQRGESPISELEEIGRQLQRMQKIVSSLLSFGRSSGEFTLIQFELIIDQAIELLGHGGRSRRIPVNRQGDPLPKIRAQAQEIEQILIHLLDNAMDATPADRATQPILIRHQVAIDGNAIEITIQDHGDGMTPEVKEKLFTPFFSTKPDGQGTGMGLAVVKSIIDRHQGSITVKSQVGEGTIFSFRLPIDPERHQKTRGPSRKILIVDDDRLLSKVLSDFLQKHGYETLTAFSAEEALSLLPSHQIHLCLLDMVMPGMDGLAFIAELKRRQLNFPVFLVTGYPNTPEVSKALQAGVREVLIKPLTPEYLINRVLVRIESVGHTSP